jgi:hypothetical protein
MRSSLAAPTRTAPLTRDGSFRPTARAGRRRPSAALERYLAMEWPFGKPEPRGQPFDQRRFANGRWQSDSSPLVHNRCCTDAAAAADPTQRCTRIDFTGMYTCVQACRRTHRHTTYTCCFATIHPAELTSFISLSALLSGVRTSFSRTRTCARSPSNYSNHTASIVQPAGCRRRAAFRAAAAVRSFRGHPELFDARQVHQDQPVRRRMHLSGTSLSGTSLSGTRLSGTSPCVDECT